jgi:uracil-DNA glycosylase family 4
MSDLGDVHRQVAVCKLCDLWVSRTQTVPGAGDPEARVMFVGEGPGFHEDRQGLPFVGAAGRLLDQLLASIGLDRSEVFITNVVKCRPPNNRDPEPIEIETCFPYLQRQLDLIDPEIVVTLGRYSMARFLGAGQSITRIHGQVRRVGGRMVLPLFHPAAALRQERYRACLEQDFLLLPKLLSAELDMGPSGSATSDRNDRPDDVAGPTQLNLL